MDNKKYLRIAALSIVAVLALFVIKRHPQIDPKVTDFQSCEIAGGEFVDGEPVKCIAPDGRIFEEADHQEPEVIVDAPKFGELVTSPLHVSGKARGFWFFEANIPVTLKDQNGKVLVQIGMQATSNWMTEDFVPFDGDLIFPTPETEYGVLIIQKDNPSGDPQFDAAYAIPVRFK